MTIGFAHLRGLSGSAMFLLTVLVLAGCDAPSDAPSDAGAAQATATAAQDIHPESGLRIIGLTVQAKGASHRFRVEVAATGEEQARGLMFRAQLAPDEGMIFPMNPPRPAAFWMRNTVIPLDMIFIAPDHTILNIAANTTPYDETPHPSAGDVMAVLELAGGRAQELGIVPGDTVSW